MQPGKKISIVWYAVMDYIMAAMAWLLIYFLRSNLINDKGVYPISIQSWLLILLIVPAG
jgi:hypothetical protein